MIKLFKKIWIWVIFIILSGGIVWGASINVLTIHSHPQAGDYWTVSFETKGLRDLIITPEDQNTINDMDFVSLKCGDEERIPQILEGDVIFYPNWYCFEEAEIVHIINVARKHTLKFQFGKQEAYAYNAPGWVIPTSGSGWTYNYRARDNDLATWASNTVQPQTWSPFIYLTHAAIDCDKIRFYALRYSNSIDTIDIDVYYEDDWHHVYQGGYADRVYVEKSIPEGTKSVTQVRASIYNRSVDTAKSARIYEIHFWEVEEEEARRTISVEPN